MHVAKSNGIQAPPDYIRRMRSRSRTVACTEQVSLSTLELEALHLCFQLRSFEEMGSLDGADPEISSLWHK